MQLDVDIEPTFRFTYMKWTDKQKDITVKQYFLSYELMSSVTDGQTDGQTESDAYEPTLQYAQNNLQVSILVI